MRIDNGRLVLGRKDCWCGDGTTSTLVTCMGCTGTGNGPRGGRGGCRKCHGSGSHHNHDLRSTCRRCGGDFKNSMREDMCDHITDDDWEAFEFRVVRTNRQMTWGESYLGAGVFSVVDYGEHKTTPDDVLIKDVKSHGHVQATKIADSKTGQVADYIAILTADQGYSVVPVFTKETT